MGPLQHLMTDLQKSGFMGTIEIDPGSRVAHSTDNSVYQLVPEGVIAPRHTEDLALLLRHLGQPDFDDISITARGGGTGTNGQSLNTGVIIDFRRYMNQVIEINEKDGWADVQPGVVLDDLNNILKNTGLFFAPTTSTSNRCTIGGMVSTDASGKGSLLYGKTSDNLIGLEVMLSDGNILNSLEPENVGRKQLLAKLASACDSGREALLETVPQIKRRFVGFDLERARPEKTKLEWWRLFVGAEGTLGLVTKIRVRLTKRPKHTSLVVLAFENFSDALNTAEELLTHNPSAIETMDDKVLSLAKNADLLDRLPDSIRNDNSTPWIYNLVEFTGEDPDRLEDDIDAMQKKLSKSANIKGSYVTRDPGQINAFWSLRKASVGLLGGMSGKRRPVSFVEDCVVPPKNLPAFASEFREILTRHGLKFGMFGHVDVGCLHVRPALNIDLEEDRDLLKEISDEVYTLVKRHNGIFWGEHGKGVRGQYLRDFVGETAYSAFLDIKRVLDPKGRFNPGKLVDNFAELYDVRNTPFRKQNSSGPLANSYSCNGNALCLDFNSKTTMCPSYKATLDLKLSPKGRSEILRAWDQAEGDGSDKADIQENLFSSLDKCLGCKACAGSCPMQVDIPEMKSVFLEDYYASHRRPLTDRIAIALEQYAPLIQKVQPLLRIGNLKPLKNIFERVFKLNDLPDLSHPVRDGNNVSMISFDDAEKMCWAGNTVFLVQDPYTSLFDDEAIISVAQGLEALGYQPKLLPLLPGGKAAHTKGARNIFTAQAKKLVTRLNTLSKKGVPFVGIDPAFVLMFRSEFPKLRLEQKFNVLLVQEFLCQRKAKGDKWPKLFQKSKLKLFLHCTEQSIAKSSNENWLSIFNELGINVEIAKSGCCGMAGMFGHEFHHYDMSQRIFDLSWKEAIEDDYTNYATGFSCRCQTKRFAQESFVHPMSIISKAANPREEQISPLDSPLQAPFI